MDVKTAYCSACDRTVRVVLDTDGRAARPDAGDDPHDLVCLEYDETCTGDFCPLFKVPPEATSERHRNPPNRVGGAS